MPSLSGPKRSVVPLRLPKRYVSDRRPHRRRIRVVSYQPSSFIATKPPLPAAVMACVRAKLVATTSALVPVRVPRSHESSTSQLSSITSNPCRSAISRMRSQSGQLPTRSGARIARVRGLIISSMRSTSIWNVSGSTSTNAGTMPDCTSGATSDENVTTGVITSSPGSHPIRSTARRIAEVPEFTITPCCFASSSAIAPSNRSTRSPISSVVVRSTSTTASISRSSWFAPASVTVRPGRPLIRSSSLSTAGGARSSRRARPRSASGSTRSPDRSAPPPVLHRRAACSSNRRTSSPCTRRRR